MILIRVQCLRDDVTTRVYFSIIRVCLKQFLSLLLLLLLLESLNLLRRRFKLLPLRFLIHEIDVHEMSELPCISISGKSPIRPMLIVRQTLEFPCQNIKIPGDIILFILSSELWISRCSSLRLLPVCSLPIPRRRRRRSFIVRTKDK